MNYVFLVSLDGAIRLYDQHVPHQDTVIVTRFVEPSALLYPEPVTTYTRTYILDVETPGRRSGGTYRIFLEKP